MKWKPNTPVTSLLSPKFNVHDYKKDFEIDFTKGILTGDTVTGFENFKQKFINVILAEQTPVFTYGLFELIPQTNEQSKFNCECEKLSTAILEHKFSDSTPHDPNGLGFSIEKIHSIERVKDSD